MDERVEYLFGNQGLLAQHLKGFKEREGQMMLVESVIQAIETGKHLLAEAPTGTGKSLATAIPGSLLAMTEGKPIVYVTSGINLQEQLMYKDMPVIADVLRGEVLDDQEDPVEFTYTLLKGMSNYLCLQSFDEELRKKNVDPRLAEIHKWAKRTTTGDRSELEFEDRAIWSKVSASSDDCVGQRCPYYKNCFIFKARAQAKQVHVIVTNYHMWFTDMMIKDNFGADAGFLPEHDVVIMDEAHDAPDIAMDFYGFRLNYLTVRSAIRKLHGLDEKKATKAYSYASIAAEQFFEAVARRWKDVGERIIEEPLGWDHDLADALHQAASAYEHHAALAKTGSDESASVIAKRFEMRSIMCQAVAASVRQVAFGFVDEGDVKRLGSKEEVGELMKGRVYYFEDMEADIPEMRKFAQVCCKDVHPQKFFRKHVFEKKTAIMLSATMASGGNFKFIAKQFGLEQSEYISSISPSPFKLDRVLSCVPRDFPSPSEQRMEHIRAVARTLLYLGKEMTKGGILALFTSHESKKQVSNMIANELVAAGVTVLEQGMFPKKFIINTFKAAYEEEKKAIILATQSFWQGVDIPGQALSVVAIDKLPFPTPDDPVLWYLDQRGIESFNTYSVPTAIIAVKQGVGRLIRTELDYGAVVIFDPRIHTARYGGLFEEAIPHYWETEDPTDIPFFLRDMEHADRTSVESQDDREAAVAGVDTGTNVDRGRPEIPQGHEKDVSGDEEWGEARGKTGKLPRRKRKKRNVRGS